MEESNVNDDRSADFFMVLKEINYLSNLKHEMYITVMNIQQRLFNS